MGSNLKDHALSKGLKSMFSVQRSGFVLVDFHREVFREVQGRGRREPALCEMQHVRTRLGHKLRLSIYQNVRVF